MRMLAYSLGNKFFIGFRICFNSASDFAEKIDFMRFEGVKKWSPAFFFIIKVFGYDYY